MGDENKDGLLSFDEYKSMYRQGHLCLSHKFKLRVNKQTCLN